MPDGLSPQLAADAAAFVAALPATVVMPAGAGKTHLLSAAAKSVVDRSGRVLVLTHTNAGADAVKTRLRTFGLLSDVAVLTLSAFAFRLACAYPELGQIKTPRVMDPAQSTAYVEAAIRIASSRHIGAVLAASYTHLLVDEYQDCNEMQHALILAIRSAVPATGVLGDPLQAIFGFNERLADWDAVLTQFPLHSSDPQPHRWNGHNEALGDWLLRIRPRMVAGHVVDWGHITLPAGVTFREVGRDPRGVRQAARVSYPADETVLIIASRSHAARTIAADLGGSYTVMEEVAGKFMAARLTALGQAHPDAYAHWLFQLTKDCLCGHGILDPKPLGQRYAQGRTGANLLKGGAGKRAGAEEAIAALDAVVLDPTLSAVAAAMDRILTSSKLRLHSHEAWYDIQRAIRGAASTGTTEALLEELAKARDALRYGGRRARNRVISRTLLVKGLEYDHVIIADVNEHPEINDLYVALSRARKSIVILGSSGTLTLRPSQNGREAAGNTTQEN